MRILVVEDDLEAFENVDALAQNFQLVLETLANGLQAEIEEVKQNILQPEPAPHRRTCWRACSNATRPAVNIATPPTRGPPHDSCDDGFVARAIFIRRIWRNNCHCGLQSLKYPPSYCSGLYGEPAG